MNNLTLGIAPQTRDPFFIEGDRVGALPADIKARILDRDNHTCRYCGFTAEKYQDVHVLDGDTANTREYNLVAACIFCAQVPQLDAVARMRSGVLVWLPEIEQPILNHIARSIYVARISQGAMAETAKKALEILIKRREEAKNRIHTDDPQVLAMVLQDFAGARQYDGRAKKLDGIKLFPLDRRIIKEGDLEFNQFPQILAYWRSKKGPFGGKIPSQWKNAYAELVNNTLSNAA